MWIATGVNAENGKIPWGSNRLEIQGEANLKNMDFLKMGVQFFFSGKTYFGAPFSIVSLIFFLFLVEGKAKPGEIDMLWVSQHEFFFSNDVYQSRIASLFLMNYFHWGSCLLCWTPQDERYGIRNDCELHHRRDKNSEPFDRKLNALTTPQKIHQVHSFIRLFA